MPDHNAPEKTTLVLSGSTYDKLKPVAAIALPALAALYLTLGQTWDLPKPEQVSATIGAVNTFLGIILGLSSRAYKKSDAKYDGIITHDEDGTKFGIELEDDTDNIPKKKEILLKVRPKPYPHDE